MRGAAWFAIGLLVTMAVAGQAAGAQTLVTPSAHFGAGIFPEFEPIAQVGLHFDRFTEFGKDTTPDGAYTFGRRYRVRETIGLNLAAFAWTDRLRLFGSRTTLYRVALQAGLSNDQPTERFQNEIVHRIRDLREVPRQAIRKEFEAGVSFDVNHWLQAGSARLPLFVGAGAATSTMLHELFVQGGLRVPRTGLSLVTRAGRVFGSGVFRTRAVARHYAMLHGSLRAPLDDWLTGDAACTWICALVPELEAGLTWSSGAFRAESGDAVEEVFCTVRLTWGPVNFETWNDSCGDKDEGPTFGVRLFARSQAFTIRKLFP